MSGGLGVSLELGNQRAHRKHQQQWQAGGEGLLEAMQQDRSHRVVSTGKSLGESIVNGEPGRIFSARGIGAAPGTGEKSFVL